MVTNGRETENMSEQTATRYAVLLRDSQGRVEILGQVHQTDKTAQENGAFWQEHYHGGAAVTAEVVQFELSLRGRVVQSRRDIVKPEPFQPTTIEA